ncbi:hypothetical protein [Lacinutrix sp.]|uniref:hypothetical protein n=1 Tax=Lacinutrix sp. TaxID=1937692 RepID=UPI002626B835|nr:hypothetical protein [Lacinutrix sp.]MDG1714872.1 hypothetical protein [Lacinutrix sp.]
MKVKILILLIFISLINCKSVEKTPMVNYNIKLSDYIKMYSEQGLISEDPLIIVNSKPYKLYSELNEDDKDLMEQSARSYSYIKQKSKYFLEKLGARAYGGIVHIKKVIVLYCGISYKRDYLINGKLSTFEEFNKLFFIERNYKYYNSIDRLELGENKYISISIIETK